MHRRLKEIVLRCETNSVEYHNERKPHAAAHIGGNDCNSICKT